MSHKHKGSRHSTHGKIVSGVLAAALAFTVVVASQVGGIDTTQLTAMVCPDGAVVPDGQPCPPPPGGGGGGSQPQMVVCPDGSSYPAPYTCPTQQQQMVYCPNGQSYPAPYTCPTQTTTTQTSGGSASSYVTQPTCQGAGYFWHYSTNRCFSTMAEMDAAGGTSSSTGTNNTSSTGAVETVGSCQNRGGVWNASSSTCTVGSTSGTTTSTSTQNWPTKSITWNSVGLSSMVCDNAPQAEIDARKLIVKGLTRDQISWPNPTDCSRTDIRAGFPEKGTSTNTSTSGTVWNNSTMTGAQLESAKSGCASARGTWDTAMNYCKMPGMTDSGMNTGAVDTVGACTARGGLWTAGSSTCSVRPTQTGIIGTTTYPNTGMYNTAESCRSARGTWDDTRKSCSTGSYDNNRTTDTMNNPGQWNDQYKTQGDEMRDKESCNSRGGTWRSDNTGAKWCEENRNAQMDGRFNTMLPMGQPFGQGMNNNGMFPGFGTQGNQGFFNEGTFTPPTYDAREMTAQYAEYGFNEDAYEFDKFQIDWDAEYQGPQIQNVKQELSRVQREGKNQQRQIDQMKKELTRNQARAGGNTACPAIANAQAALSTAEAVVSLMVNATEDTIEQAMTAQGQLFGNWESPEGIWNEVNQAVQGAHSCEQVAQMQKDGGRDVKEMTKELSRVRDAETKSYLEEVLTEYSSVVNNLGDYYVPCEGGFGPCDPMEEARYAMDDLRMSFWDAMRDQHEEFQYDDVCSNFDMIREHLSEATDIPDDILAKASALLNRGVSYCEAGNIDGASKVLRDMEKLKNEFDGGGSQEGFGRNAIDYMREAAEFEFSDGEVDIDALMAKMEELFLSRMETAVQAAVDRVTQQFTMKIAQMESNFAARLSQVQAQSLDNIGIAFERGDLKDEIIEAKTEVAESIADFDEVLVAFEEEDIEIAAELEARIEEIYEFATVHNLTTEAAKEFSAEIDALTNEVVIAFQESPETAAEVLAEAIPELTETAQRIYEDDKDAQLESGMLAFSDLHGLEDSWTFGWLTAAKNDGIVNGSLNAEGVREVNAGSATNWAEGLTMMGRLAAGGAENIPDEVDLSNPVIRELPDFAQAPATYLINEGLIEADRLAEIYGNSNPGDAITRIEMMEVVSDVLALTGDAGAISDFPDVGGLDADARTAAATLVDLGIVGGEGNGNLNPNGELNRAAFAKIMIGAQDVAIAEGTLEFPEPQGGFEANEEFPTPQGGFEETEGVFFEEDENVPTI